MVSEGRVFTPGYHGDGCVSGCCSVLVSLTSYSSDLLMMYIHFKI